ncbi:hypothetical protein BUE63_14100 [Bacillus sp. MB353a]|nr:hypothetical protein [Bacillus sp. MB353a]OWW09597.1 hypothetical protein BUE63_14100 [Bacillus sp. MB353a]
MYDSLVLYLKEHNIRLERYMFCAVLKSLNLRNEGYSSRSANDWAYTTELIGYVGDGVAENPDIKKAKRELAKYSKEVWKFHNEKES